MSIEVVVIITPAEGKADRIIELLEGVGKVVEATEQGTLRYEVAKQIMSSGPPKIFVLENYKDAAALKAHGQFSEFGQMRETMEKEKLATAKEIYVMSSVGGVKSRL